MKNLKVNVKVNIPMKLIGKEIEVYSLPAIQYVMGTVSAAGNLRLYNIRKLTGRVWRIPLETLYDRINVLEDRKRKIDASLELMKDIEKSIKGKKK